MGLIEFYIKKIIGLKKIYFFIAIFIFINILVSFNYDFMSGMVTEIGTYSPRKLFLFMEVGWSVVSIFILILMFYDDIKFNVMQLTISYSKYKFNNYIITKYILITVVQFITAVILTINFYICTNINAKKLNIIMDISLLEAVFRVLIVIGIIMVVTMITLIIIKDINLTFIFMFIYFFYINYYVNLNKLNNFKLLLDIIAGSNSHISFKYIYLVICFILNVFLFRLTRYEIKKS